ncbi:Zinc finger protein CONSTANS-LIKE [Musa troglodytarum]|uniref:Zinc finger protein CONSTANS-LIKE n=1 Tax=Musa troglodytarum TaxID=320322 RepID=A0A9E7F2D0_9LILI|nr:Zinc finger protein CONSTANS-LIKE [Musa troglodytarum]
MVREAEGKGGYWARQAARRCNSCKVAVAHLYCRADAAYLCSGCDMRVQGADQLASRHKHVWTCQACKRAPATVTCKADAAVLCDACDADIHSANPLACRHKREPVVPFLEPIADPIKPSAAFAFGAEENDADEAAAASWILPNPGHAQFKGSIEAPLLKSMQNYSSVDSYLDLEYALSMETRFHQMNSVVPVRAKTAIVDCEPPPISSFLPPVAGAELDFVPTKPCHTTHSMSQSMPPSEVGVIPDESGGAGNAAAQMDREARVMRYREKRKNRRFEKTIRYASRKAYAETRPRIKGRFAKRANIEAEVDRIYPSAPAAAAALMADAGFGVVPSF